MYAPSFTAQIVQEAPIMITEAQAQKLLQKSFTGFEYRPSVSIVSAGAGKNYKVQKGYTIPKNILNPKVSGVKNRMQTQRKSNVRTKINTKINFNPKVKGMTMGKTTKINFNPKVKTGTLF